MLRPDRAVPLLAAFSLAAPSPGQTEIWSTTSLGQRATGVATDGADGVYVATEISASRACLRRVDAAGVVQIVDCFDYGTGFDVELTTADAELDGAGGVVLAGTWSDSLSGEFRTYVRRYDASGALVGALLVDPDATGYGLWLHLARSGSGAIHASGTIFDPAANREAAVTRFAPDGSVQWSTRFGSPARDSVHGMAAGAGDGVLVVGDTLGALGAPSVGGMDAWFAFVDAAGAVGTTVQLGTAGTDTCSAVAADPAGGFWIAGETSEALFGPSDGLFDVWIARVDAGGVVRDAVQFGGPSSDRVRGMTVDVTGGIVLAGFSSGDFADAGFHTWVARFDRSLDVSWSRAYPGQSGTMPFDVERSQSGAIHVVGQLPAGGWMARLSSPPEPTLGALECAPAEPNSTGAAAVVRGLGVPFAATNLFRLEASALPPGSFGYFLTSRVADVVPMAGGSLGTLCLGGPIGRFVGPNQVAPADAAGRIELRTDLAALPTPTGPMPVAPGETHRFQLWYRDASPTGPVSNFSASVAVPFE